MPNRPKQKQQHQNRPTRHRSGEGNAGSKREKQVAPARGEQTERSVRPATGTSRREDRDSRYGDEEDRRPGRQRDREDDDARDQEIHTRHRDVE
jgi:hypothetical protein